MNNKPTFKPLCRLRYDLTSAKNFANIIIVAAINCIAQIGVIELVLF
jgi:hypothetical protein